MFRSTIDSLFPSQINKRKLNANDDIVRETQDKFEKKCKLAQSNDDDIGGLNVNNGNQNQAGFFNNIRNPNRLVKYTVISFLSGLFVGIIICASILLAIFFIWYLNNTYASQSVVNKYMKPTYLWNERETYEWLQQLGPWSMTQIAPIANKLGLSKAEINRKISNRINFFTYFFADGTALLELNEEKLLNEPFNLTDNFYRDLFIDSINALKLGFGVPMQNLCEFKVTQKLKTKMN